MGTRSLELFFQPKSIAVIGASERRGSLGGLVIRNLIAGNFAGPIIPINARGYDSVYSLPALSRINQLVEPVDLAVICTPPETVPRIIKQLHSKGIGAAILLTGGFARTRSWQFWPSREPLEQAIKQTGIRILGPDCLGMVIPGRKLNASFLHVPVKRGHIAYVGQSGTLASGVMDWAYCRNIGFSHVLTLGKSQDVTLPNLIDYIVQEPQVRTLLIQLDEFGSGKPLLRALRAASRQKLVLAVKSNRFQESPLNTIPTPKGIRSRDILIDEVFARAGVLRVSATDEMFDTVDALSHRRESFGPRLAVIANGRGPAILALDRLQHDKGQLAKFADETKETLGNILPDHAHLDNPILLNPELDPQQLTDVSKALLHDQEVDALLVIYSPSRGSNPTKNAEALVELAATSNKVILTSWMGEYSVQEARDLFDNKGIPTFDTPDNAIKSYMYMVAHQRTQDLLRETPESLEIPISSSYKEVDKAILEIQRPGDYLMPNFVWDLLNAYGFSCAEARYRKSLDEVLEHLDEVPGPWVLRVHHRRYLYPFAYGTNPRERLRSVARNLKTKEAIIEAANDLEGAIAKAFTDSPVLGYTIQTMHRALDNLQFSFGIGRDSEMGPFLFFGGGGSNADILIDRQVALPPLNANLAEKLIKRSHFYQVLSERSKNIERELITLKHWLVALSHLALNHPWISGLEINAIRRKPGLFLVIGVAGEIGQSVKSAILPYPNDLEAHYESRSGNQYLIRPIRAEDEPQLETFYHELSTESLRLRFFSTRRQFGHSELASFAQIDYDREMAFVATRNNQLYGVVQVWIDPDDLKAEFSIIIHDDCHGEGLGLQLMREMIAYLTDRGVLQIYSTVLPHNRNMLKLAERLGFKIRQNFEEGVVDVVKNLNPVTDKWQNKRIYRF